jgi:hypothetical protein
MLGNSGGEAERLLASQGDLSSMESGIYKSHQTLCSLLLYVEISSRQTVLPLDPLLMARLVD